MRAARAYFEAAERNPVTAVVYPVRDLRNLPPGRRVVYLNPVLRGGRFAERVHLLGVGQTDRWTASLGVKKRRLTTLGNV